MPDQKLSLEDILNEYSPKPKTSNSVNDSRLETEKLLNSAEKIGSRKSAEEIIKENDHLRTLRKHSQPTADTTLRRPNPANDVKPGDVPKNKVSFVKSEVMNEIRTGSNKKFEPKAPVNQTDNTPKIRRMSDSTRAKEVESIKKRKKRRNKGNMDFTYAKESPEGEYVYSPPKVKKKKRSRSVAEEANLPENKKTITDIVPSPAAVEASKPVTPAPRAEKTSINLSETPDYDANTLDIHITQEADEFISAKTKKKRTKRMIDFNYYGDVEDVGRDIYDLKSTISVRVMILAATAFLSLYITLANQFGLPIIDILNKSNTYYYLAAHFILGMIAVVSSMTVITNGLKKFIKFRSDSDSMAAITSAACLIAIIPAFFTPELITSNNIHVYMPIGILSLLINAFGKLLIVKRASRNFKFISKDVERHGVTYVRDEERAEILTRGTLGDFPILASMRKTDFLTDFLKYSYSSDMTDTYCRKASPLCLIFSIVISGFITFAKMGSSLTADSSAFFFSILTMLLSAASCIALPLVSNIPLEKVSNRIFKNHGVMLGYQSVDDFYDTNSILIDAKKLFPNGTVKLAGIKVFSNTKIDDALLQAASLTYHAGSIMHQLFTDVVAEKEGVLYPIENFSYEESMGFCGWINNRRVLFGNREFMTSHNIEGIPTKTKESEYCSSAQEAMYLSISGNLAAMFIVDITADREVKYWVKKLDKKKICLIIKSMDACLSLKKLSSLFGIPEEMMRIIPKKLHEEFDAETNHSIRLSASMACSGKFTTLAQLIIGTKVVHSASIIGLIFQSVSILLGLGLSILLIMSKAFDYNYLSASSLIIYNLVCTLFTYAAASFKKL